MAENKQHNTPSKNDLRRLQERAKEKAENVHAARAKTHKDNKKGPGKFRIGIWVAEFFILVAVIQHFVISPLTSGEPVSEASTSAQEKQSLAEAEKVPDYGKNALELQQLEAIEEAHFPVVEDFPDGAKTAIETQKTVSKDYKLPVEVENSIGMKFRLIPQGTFLMGSPEGEKGRWEGEVQYVENIPSPIYVGKYEVTQEQWLKIMDNNPSHFQGNRRPVEEIKWEQCMKFAKKLTEREELPGGTYRLPLEKEWEYACRGGTKTAYFFGNNRGELKKYAIYLRNSNKQTYPVTGPPQKPPNPFGLYNMHGNVWEWCINKFRHYPEHNATNEYRQWRAIRGGNWKVGARKCRSANRSHLPPDSNGNMLGFRLIRTIPELVNEEKGQKNGS